ncbi:MAG: SGNH/GDSL hydrolase family protein [Burkholderiales bacterium]
MQQIFVYGDSLSWGIIPNTRARLPFDSRWPGVMENSLNAREPRVRVIEDCLNGRRTVWDDPFKPGRNGLAGLAQRIESQSPLALVVLMLGVNDFQSMHTHNAWHSAQGVAALINAIRTAPIEPGMPVPPILVVAPPPLAIATGTMAPKFSGGDSKCVGLADAYREVAAELGCDFFDAGTVIACSKLDGVHLDAAEHLNLGEAMANIVRRLLSRSAQS